MLWGFLHTVHYVCQPCILLRDAGGLCLCHALSLSPRQAACPAAEP